MSNLTHKELPAHIEAACHTVIGRAIEVHRVLGPGLLESLYEDALVYELRDAGLRVDQQVDLAVPYKATTLRGQRLDVLVLLKDGLRRVFNERSPLARTDVHGRHDKVTSDGISL
ncbi:MAG: GxxExxY protein [Planctomycetota bacterium]|nr:GxxExxY protein [Planctomycetota bacterium]